MKNRFCKNIVRAPCAFAAVVLTVLATPVVGSDCGEEGRIDFRIITAKIHYSPGAIARVKFIITNTGEEPLYLFRSVSDCTSQIGSYLFWILDQDNKEVPLQRCSVDLAMDERVINELADPKFGIALRKNDIYGLEEEFQLPVKKGTYRLKAELWPPGFTDKQKEILSQKHMRVLQCRISAPIVQITVK